MTCQITKERSLLEIHEAIDGQSNLRAGERLVLRIEADVQERIRNITELAWAAGFFDGEGSVGVSRDRNDLARYLSLHIGQRDPRPLLRFKNVVGGRLLGPYTYRGGEHAGAFRLTYSGQTAERIADQLLPYLSEPKREQLDLAHTCIAQAISISEARIRLAALREEQK